MNVGTVLVEDFLPAHPEPRVWEVAAVERGKVELFRLNPANLARTGESQKIDLYYALRMRVLDPDDKTIQRLARLMQQQRSDLRRLIDGLPLASNGG